MNSQQALEGFEAFYVRQFPSKKRMDTDHAAFCATSFFAAIDLMRSELEPGPIATLPDEGWVLAYCADEGEESWEMMQASKVRGGMEAGEWNYSGWLPADVLPVPGVGE